MRISGCVFRFCPSASSFPAINSAEYQRRAPRHDYSIMFVQRKAPRHDYSLMFVQRRAPHRDYKRMFVQRRAPRHDYSLMFVQRRAPRRDYTIMFVQRKAPRHDYTIMFVQRRAPRRQSYDTSHRRNGRGGACVPARTSAQRRFHRQRTRPPAVKEAFPYAKGASPTRKSGVSMRRNVCRLRMMHTC